MNGPYKYIWRSGSAYLYELYIGRKIKKKENNAVKNEYFHKNKYRKSIIITFRENIV